MATSHVAHDCHVGSRVVMANGTALAGHVTLGDGCILGGLVGIHQFVKVGRLAFIGAGAMVAQDVPPFMMAVGDRARLIGVNTLGLERVGLNVDQIRVLKTVYKLLCLSDLKLVEALDKISTEHGDTAEAREVLEFVRASERGICR
ncbi:MAG: hypothetical protein HYT87_11195 [Nitrospirae bacterium]|nr:hypothetical protein [Nitrospirota bacterium]